MQETFERFCKEYNIEYNFKRNGRTQYFDTETQKAFIIFKYSYKYIRS